MMSFFFNDTATTEIYTLSLHDALPIWTSDYGRETTLGTIVKGGNFGEIALVDEDRKSTRLNSSH